VTCHRLKGFTKFQLQNIIPTFEMYQKSFAALDGVSGHVDPHSTSGGSEQMSLSARRADDVTNVDASPSNEVVDYDVIAHRQ